MEFRKISKTDLIRSNLVPTPKKYLVASTNTQQVQATERLYRPGHSLRAESLRLKLSPYDHGHNLRWRALERHRAERIRHRLGLTGLEHVHVHSQRGGSGGVIKNRDPSHRARQ